MGIEDILMHDESLFQNINAFDPDYVPPNYNFRDTQMEAMAMAIMMHPDNMKQLILRDRHLYELRDKENLTFKEMNAIDIKEWSQEEELFALARHLIKYGHWNIAKSVLLYAHPDAGDTADFDACIAYTMYKMGQQEQMLTYVRKALEGKSDILFELFGLIYDADMSVETFVSGIKK